MCSLQSERGYCFHGHCLQTQRVVLKLLRYSDQPLRWPRFPQLGYTLSVQGSCMETCTLIKKILRVRDALGLDVDPVYMLTQKDWTNSYQYNAYMIGICEIPDIKKEKKEKKERKHQFLWPTWRLGEWQGRITIAALHEWWVNDPVVILKLTGH